MGATVVVVRSVNARPTVVDGWPGGTGWAASGFSDVIFAPPASLEDVGRRSGLIVLALPADELLTSLTSLRGAISPEAAIASTCPVVSLERIRCLVGPVPSLFRVIVPSGIEHGEGVAALSPEPGTVPEVVERVKRSLAWIGAVEVVSEEALDAVAAVALGGAAFMCSALEGLEEGAVSEGLPRATARSFAHQTALATALLLREHPGSPADLKDQVASPGGTTIAALAMLEDAAVRGAFIHAVQRSASRVRAARDATRPSVIE